ncbi:hypothetical protein RHGRI_002403 [Rhododendron griersonianum]|uniref:Uncharacterized protein n=1 Tax=Rhododendron griersonianum TaxID=479676 RepID=A0AAV6LRZ1_9ERIC|nr:hypothetical protein RHGRI_002403 [Rhododendron griersonianum]
MKSTSGKITSTKEISLSKASKVLSKFVHVENGASQAVSSYLRRALASFDELVQLHKDLKATKPVRKPRKPEQESSTLDGETVKQEENEGSEGKRHKKRRKSEESSLKKEKKRRRIEGED